MPRHIPLVQAKRRAPFYVLCVFLVTISFAILSLLKLEPIAQNLVQDHNSNIDLQQLVNSTIDTPQDAKIEDKEKTSEIGLNLPEVSKFLLGNLSLSASAARAARSITRGTFCSITWKSSFRFTRIGPTKRTLAGLE